MAEYKICGCPESRWDHCGHSWWLSRQFRGERVRFSLDDHVKDRRITTRLEARAEFDKLKVQMREGTFVRGKIRPSEPGAIGFSDFITNYYWPDWIVAEGREQERTSSRLNVAKKFFKNRPIGAIDSALVGKYLQWLRQPAMLHPHEKSQRARSKWTVGRHQSDVSNAFDKAVLWKFIKRSPFNNEHGIRQYKRPANEKKKNRRRRHVTSEEWAKLFAVASPTMQAEMIGAADTGMRAGEQYGILICDLEARPGWIRIRAEISKDEEERYVPIATARLADVIDGRRKDGAGETKGPDAFVFCDGSGGHAPSRRKAWETIRLKAFGCKVRRHKKTKRLSQECQAALKRINLRWNDWRHWCATTMLNAGVPIEVVKEWLGHDSVTTTELYDSGREQAVLMAGADVFGAFVKKMSSPAQDERKDGVANPTELV